jgi:RNA polymerase subunit RPABC4/transcription elongation factor Spt4
MDALIKMVNNPWFFIALGGLAIGYMLTLSVVLAIWTARDIARRTKNPLARIFTPVFVFMFGFAGFFPYVVLRPRKTFEERAEERHEQALLAAATKGFSCPTCKAAVEEDFAFCPNCKSEFKAVCVCGSVLEANWKRCGYCGVSAPTDLAERKFKKPVSMVRPLELPSVNVTTTQIWVRAQEPSVTVVPPDPISNTELPKPVVQNKNVESSTKPAEPVAKKEKKTSGAVRSKRTLFKIDTSGVGKFATAARRAFAIKR